MADQHLTKAFLVRRSLLVRRLARLVRCRDTAEDLAQETWLRSRRAGAIDAPIPFLDRVALNLARDHLRGAAIRSGAAVTALRDLPSAEPDPERICLDRDRVRRAERALASLPARRRDVFLAARLEGLPHAVIAARFGITTATVQKHIARAMMTLTAAMADKD